MVESVRSDFVVLRDETAERNSRERIQLQRDRFEDLPADVLEINIDSLGRRRAKILGEIIAFVIHARVEAEFLYHQIALRFATRDSHSAASFDLRDLSRDAADGSCSR